MRMRSKEAPGGTWRWGVVAGVGLLAVWLAWLFCTPVEILVPERDIEVHLLPGNLPLMGPKQGLYSKLGSGFMGRRVREGVRYFPQVPEGHYTLFAMRRDEDFTDVHREELDVPAGGQVRFPLLPMWSRFDD